MTWEGNKNVFRGYAKGDGKSPTMKVKTKDLLTWEQVQTCQSFGGVLQDGAVDISFDTDELSQKFWDMAEKNGWKCLILENPSNGHIHSYWKDTKKRIEKGGKDKKLSVGLVADIHSGFTYIPLKVDGVERFPPSFEPEELDEIPDELVPVTTSISLLNLKSGDGRNDSLFRYILVLQSQLGLTQDQVIHVLRNVNDFILSDPMDEGEFATITRDEAFEAPLFYNGKKFLHNTFGTYLKTQYHIRRINGQLHIYSDGCYQSGYRLIESKMTEVIPDIKSAQRVEVLKYLEVTTPKDESEADARYVAFENGVYDIETKQVLPPDPEYNITNLIPWSYDPEAYDELTDRTLTKISCGDPQIRALLEECIGWCFFRHSEQSRCFILTGEGANGKSTYFDMVKTVLGRRNYVSLDLDEVAERFSTTTLSGVLADIGDDISDDFLQGKNISIFKKLVTGNDLKGENKGQDVYFFKPYAKLLFSANVIPRMRNKGLKAIKRRLVIIPFNATFSKSDPDYDPGITWKLKNRSTAQYLIRLGVEGLHRVLKNGFTESEKVKEEIDQFEKDNNPVLLFADEVGDEIMNDTTKEAYLRYDTFCHDNGFTKMQMQTFSKEICKVYGCHIVDKRVNGRKCRVFVK